MAAAVLHAHANDIANINWNSNRAYIYPFIPFKQIRIANMFTTTENRDVCDVLAARIPNFNFRGFSGK